MLLVKHAGTHRAASVVAKLYLLELLVSWAVTRWWQQSVRVTLRLGQLLLAAALLQSLGVIVIGLSLVCEGWSNKERLTFLLATGHSFYSCGVSLREVALPVLTSCLPQKEINKLNAYRRTLLHAGALLGGLLLALGLKQTLACAMVASLACGLVALTYVLPHFHELLPSQQLAPSDETGQERKISRRLEAAALLLVLGRCVQSSGFPLSGPVVTVGLLRAGAVSSTWDTTQLLARANCAGHLSGLLVNLLLGSIDVDLGLTTFGASAALYATCLMLYGEAVQSSQVSFLLVQTALRAARATGKASSDAMAFGLARRFGAHRATFFFARRAAFKLGLLLGKMCTGSILAHGPEARALLSALHLGAVTSLLAAAITAAAAVPSLSHPYE